MNKLALTKIPYGMFIITSAFDGKIGGQIANTVFQINSNPATIAISISKQNNTHSLLSNSKKAVISTITEDASFEFIGKFLFNDFAAVQLPLFNMTREREKINALCFGSSLRKKGMDLQILLVLPRAV